MSVADALKLMKDKGVKFVDLRLTDTRGKEQHVSVPHHVVDEAFFTDGKMFDGSSIAGWKGINDSDMILMPDAETAVIDVFTEEPTMILRCDVIEPSTMQGYERDPRSAAKRAEAYLKSTGIADQAFFGPENEFFVFDDVRWASEMRGAFYAIESSEGYWQTGKELPEGNMGHRPGIKGGYFPVQPVDSLNDIRAAMCLALEEMGLTVEVHHHEVANAGQCEIGVLFGGLVKKADDVLMLKYVVQNVAHSYGKTATFMPKPLVGDNGSGMHVHQSLAKGGKNLFTGDGYGGLSQLALNYIGGIMKHAHAINVPYVQNPKGRRIEVRFPDSTANPYFGFIAMMMAGLDGIQNKINPGPPSDKDLYDLEPEEDKKIPTVCHSLDMALDYLDKDRGFLKAGGVFTDDLIDAYIELKMKEVTRLRMTTHPIEIEMYYSL